MQSSMDSHLREEAAGAAPAAPPPPVPPPPPAAWGFAGDAGASLSALSIRPDSLRYERAFKQPAVSTVREKSRPEPVAHV